MGKARFVLYGLVVALPWVSQIMFPRENILEPIFWTGLCLIGIFVIEKWGKP